MDEIDPKLKSACEDLDARFNDLGDLLCRIPDSPERDQAFQLVDAIHRLALMMQESFTITNQILQAALGPMQDAIIQLQQVLLPIAKAHKTSAGDHESLKKLTRELNEALEHIDHRPSALEDRDSGESWKNG